MNASANKIKYIIALLICNKQFFKRKAIWCCKNSKTRLSSSKQKKNKKDLKISRLIRLLTYVFVIFLFNMRFYENKNHLNHSIT